VLGADDRLAATLRPYWERQLGQTRRSPAVLRAKIEGAVVQDLPLGVPTIDRLAEKLNIGRSKLTAELSMIGGYRTVVDDVRRRLAREMVQRTDLTMSSIATHLGFSEPGALNHAYRRWTGRTPTADRAAD
jgi:AraC-like DNA-binding protein